MNGQMSYPDGLGSIFGSQNDQSIPGETALQGLFLDLLGCMDPSKNIMSGRKSKPMTGFTQILTMITETMEVRNSRVNTPSQQSTTSSEPRIHEIFQQSSSQLLGKINQSTNPVFRYVQPASSTHTNIPRWQETSSSQNLLKPSQRNVIDASNAMDKPFYPPSRIPRRQDVPSRQNIHLPQVAQRGLIGLSSPDYKNVGYKASMDSFPKQIAQELKDNDNKEVKTVLRKVVYSPSSSESMKTESGPKLKPKPATPSSESELDESAMLIGSKAVTRILDRIMGVAYHCCGEPLSGGICHYCSNAAAEDDVFSDTETSETTINSSEVSLESDGNKSNYHDCCIGDDTRGDGQLWSSESENEAKD